MAITDQKTKVTPGLTSIIVRESVVLLTLRLLIVEILLGFSFFMTTALLSLFEIAGSLFPLFLILFILLLLNTFFASAIVLKWLFEYYEVKKDGVIKYAGIISKKEEKFACHFIESTTLKQSFFGKLFNYGNLVLYDPALKTEIHLNNIPNPKRQSAIIEKMLSHENKQEIPFVAKPEIPQEEIK